jgi:hypothetical protein
VPNGPRCPLRAFSSQFCRATSKLARSFPCLWLPNYAPLLIGVGLQSIISLALFPS